MPNLLTVDDVKASLPKNLQTAATQSLTDKINGAATDPEIARNIRENFISFTTVLAEGRFKTEDYLNAVMYVSHKLLGMTNQEAYRRTFLKRYTDLVAKGMSEKDISAYVSAYNKNKLVNLVLEQTLVPTWVLNQHNYQKAINKQVDLMENANSEKVQTDAANSLLTHLKRPETKQVEVDLNIKEPEGMSELNRMLSMMAQRQQELIGQGVSTREIAHQKLGQDLGSQKHHTAPSHPEPEIIDITPVQEPAPQKAAKEFTGSPDPKKPLSSFRPDYAE